MWGLVRASDGFTEGTEAQHTVKVCYTQNIAGWKWDLASSSSSSWLSHSQAKNLSLEEKVHLGKILFYFFKQEGISTLVLCRHFCRTWKPISVHKYLLQNSTSILWKCSFPHWKKGFRVLAGCASLNLQALPPPLLMWGHCCPPIQVHLTTFDCTPVKWL